MVKDQLSQEQLHIYESDTRESKIISSIEGYDPTSRPWYAPVIENPIVQWSDIYINLDELNDATISSLVPIFDESNDLASVVCIDVNLKGINLFLKELTQQTDSFIYIIDDENHLISHSTDDLIYDTRDTEAGASFIDVLTSENQLINQSSRIIERSSNMDSLDHMTLDDEKYFFKSMQLDSTLGVNWTMVVVVSEESLVGNMQSIVNRMALLFIILTLSAIALGGVSISFLLSSLSKLAKKVNEVDLNNLEDAHVDVSSFVVKEIDSFSRAYNVMITNLKESVNVIRDRETQLIEAQGKVSTLIKDENIRLEQLVNERTRELEKVMKELLEKEKLASLGSLVSGISHEINTPLGVAISAVSYLKTLNDDNIELLTKGTMTKQLLTEFIKSLEEATDIIIINLERAKELINGFKKISVTTSRDDKFMFNIEEYIHITLISLKHELRTHKHQVNVECDPLLQLFGNPGDFHQIFTNLIMNSIIHGFDHGDGGTISIKVTNVEKAICLSYSDNGKGISEEIISKVFDPFFTTNRGKGGSGLGLNIVYNIVTGTFNGSIELHNLTRGIEFVINIPLVDNIQEGEIHG